MKIKAYLQKQKLKMILIQCLESICDQANTRKALKLLYFHCGPSKFGRLRYGKMSKKKKKKTKMKEKMHVIVKTLVIKIDIIFLSYFVEKVFLDFMFECI